MVNFVKLLVVRSELITFATEGFFQCVFFLLSVFFVRLAVFEPGETYILVRDLFNIGRRWVLFIILQEEFLAEIGNGAG